MMGLQGSVSVSILMAGRDMPLRSRTCTGTRITFGWAPKVGSAPGEWPVSYHGTTKIPAGNTKIPAGNITEVGYDLS